MKRYEKWSDEKLARVERRANVLSWVALGISFFVVTLQILVTFVAR